MEELCALISGFDPSIWLLYWVIDCWETYEWEQCRNWTWANMGQTPGKTVFFKCKNFFSIIIILNFLNIHTYSVLPIHDQCLYTAFRHSFHQCNTTEIKPQAKISPQFGVFNSENCERPWESGVLRPQTHCFTALNFLATEWEDCLCETILRYETQF